MIIKSHVRGGYRSAAEYLKDIGKNESTRLVEITDPDAKSLDEAFHNMWTVASNTKAKKPLHHVSINPFKDERLTDEQVQKIVERCEEKYGYAHGNHQRVIVEHIKEGRQHFHVIWNRVSLDTEKPVWPGMHWNKSKQAAREMEKELGLKRPIPRRMRRLMGASEGRRLAGRYETLNHIPSVETVLLRLARKAALSKTGQPKIDNPVPFEIKPARKANSWSEAAILDWENWGHEDTQRFFTKWPELAPEGFIFQSGPSS